MLLFKKKFLEPIRKGEKTQTIRFWNCSRMRAGQRSYIPGIGYIAILSVTPVEFNQLSDSDAIPDGFANASLLKSELQNLYAEEIKKGFRAYRVCFSVYPPDVQLQMQQEKQRQKEEKNKTARKKSDKQKTKEVESSLSKLKKLAMESLADKEKKND